MMTANPPSNDPDRRPVRLGPDDAGEVLTLQRSAYVTEAQTHGDLWLPPLTQSLDDLHDELGRTTVAARGFREGRRLVAAVRVELDGRTARLGRLVVAPDRQGRGWGTRLLSAVERELVETVTVIDLFTGEHSAANLRLYRRPGYTETHRSPCGDYDLVHLRKNLREPAVAGGDWFVRRAGGDDLDIVLDLLTERARWLLGKGIDGQWPEPFPPGVVQPDLDEGRTWIVERGDAAVATFTLNEEDHFWCDVGGAAGYLHRFAVGPGHPGLGARLLGWIADYLRTHHRDFLRLDCVAANLALCRYYAAAGFVERGSVVVHGLPGERGADGLVATLQRYERALGTAR